MKDNFDELMTLRKIEISGINHDIRNHMTILNSALQLIEMKHPDVKEDSMWGLIKDNTQDMIAFLNHVSKYRYSDEVKPVSCLISEFLETFSKEDNNYTTIRKLCTDASCMIDKAKLSYALCEISQNAKDNNAPLSLIVTADKKYMTLEFTTKETLLCDEELSKAFLPFYSNKKDHHGLGLSITKSTIEAHNGHINICNKANDMIITISLPL